jgi:SAM-dependent methyltransferase
MPASTSESNRWHGYYAAQTGRTTRPLFEEAMTLLGSVPAGEARLAVELGCGDGTESLALLSRGWRVLATDKQPEAIALLRARVPPEHASRLETRVAAFDDLALPACDLIYAGYSLPFTPPASFAALWAGLVRALRPGGRLAGQLFGDRDSWGVNPNMTFQTRTEALALLAALEVEVFREREEDGSSFLGPKHWHIFDLIARKRAAA